MLDLVSAMTTGTVNFDTAVAPYIQWHPVHCTVLTYIILPGTVLVPGTGRYNECTVQCTVRTYRTGYHVTIIHNCRSLLNQIKINRIEDHSRKSQSRRIGARGTTRGTNFKIFWILVS
jgi:hypothetical protein